MISNLLKNYKVFILLFFCLYFNNLMFSNTKFTFIVASYNNSKWYKKNLDSVFNQRYQNYKVIYIDDASSDKTANLVEKYIRLKNKQDKVILIKNRKRKHAMENRYKAIHMCKPDEVIVILDGDDWLAHDNVLTRLDRVYQDKNVWMTYGRHMRYPSNRIGGKMIPSAVVQLNSFRQHKTIPTALMTFYAALFHKIKKEDLMYNNSFFSMAHSAFMYPIIEMSGAHHKFIPEILYIYNRATGLNDSTINPKKQKNLSNIVRFRKPYKPLIRLF